MKAVLFDIDGTLVDSNDFHVEAWDMAFQEAGLSIDRDAIRGQIGKGGDLLVPTLAPDLDDDAQQALESRHGEIFKGEFLDRVRPFPHARDILARVRDAGGKVVLASSASQEELDHYVELLGVRDLLDATTSKDDVETSKPAPDIFSTALKKLPGVAPQDTVVVGDTPYDVEAAGKCGVAAVAVRSGGFEDAVLRDAGAVALYDDVADLLAHYDDSPLAA